MKLKLDVSDVSVVVTCSDCPHWFAFCWNRDEGYRSAERHKVNVHGVEPNKAAEARRSATRRSRGV